MPVQPYRPMEEKSGGPSFGSVPVQNNLVRVLNNQQLEDIKKTQREEADKYQNKPEILSLATHIWMHWEAAKRAKINIEHRLLKCLRQRKGVYDPKDEAQIQKFGGSQIYMMITNAKCRTIEAWLRDVMIPAGEKPWSIDSTVSPDLPEEYLEEIRQQVATEVLEISDFEGGVSVTPEMINERLDQLRKDREHDIRKVATSEADRIETRIEDHFSEGGFYEELSRFIKDFATYPAAFMKGPIVRRKKMLVWEDGPDGSKIPMTRWKYIRTWKRISPFDIYPAPSARSLQDGYLIERAKYRHRDLMKMKGVPGYNNASIDQALMEHSSGALKDWLWTDQELANLSGRPNEQDDPDAVIEALEYHGDIPGHLLIEWGVNPKRIPNPADPIPAVALLIGRHVVMARINEEPLAEKEYYSASFDASNDSIFGEAPPEIMEDCQRACNALARALINNSAMASGPQVEVQRDRLDPAENPQKMYPWKIWLTKSDSLGHNRNAIYFTQPRPMVEMLLGVYKHFFAQAGEQLGVPAYEQGLGGVAGGAGKTAHGLTLLMNAASKILKDAVMAIDSGIIKPLVYNTWVHTVLYDQDIEYRGDINIIARASEYLIVQEQLQARRAEFMAMTNNDLDRMIIGLDGRAKMLREYAKGMQLGDDVIPPDRDIESKIQESMAVFNTTPGMAAAGGNPMAMRPGRPGGEQENPALAPLETPPLQRAAQK